MKEKESSEIGRYFEKTPTAKNPEQNVIGRE